MKHKEKQKQYRVCELFAGVGGFHLGLKEGGWETIWSNQWEPGKKEQHAYNCYVHRFGNGICSNEDIDIAKYQMPKKGEYELLVGGFPCQDYSVAATKAKGIEGKKGVLWWQIDHIVRETKPPFILLENVDRLLRSPSDQRGRDFGIILACLNMHGYTVEWRMINAADYGFPQKRRRTFIFATNNKEFIKKTYKADHEPKEIILKEGYFAQEFPVIFDDNVKIDVGDLRNVRRFNDLPAFSDSFEFHFFNAGFMKNGQIYTQKVVPLDKNRSSICDILENQVDKKYFISPSDIQGWKKCKGAKKETRKTRDGFEYSYNEGAIPFPDNLDYPSRTMLTGEGNMRPNRITHIIKDPKNGKLRVLSPIETEKLNGFPPNWTNTDMPERWRYFCMGNALVVGLIERMGKRLKTIIKGTLGPRNSAEIYINIGKSLPRTKELTSVK